MSGTAPAPEPLQKLAYSIQSLADATDLSYEQVRQAIKRSELVAKYSGSKAVIRREDAIAWLDSLPDERARTAPD